MEYKNTALTRTLENKQKIVGKLELLAVNQILYYVFT